MDHPPTYAAAAGPPKRSIQDLRAQIIAHGTVIRPEHDNQYGSEDHIEVIVAETPAHTSAQQASRTPNFNGKQSTAMKSDGTLDFQLRKQENAASASASASTAVESKHYAVLIKRSGGTKIRIILKGALKDTVEEALEWMLEQTEKIMHDMIIMNSKQDTVDECVVISWFASLLVCPVALIFWVPLDEVRANAHSSDATTTSSMLNSTSRASISNHSLYHSAMASRPICVWECWAMVMPSLAYKRTMEAASEVDDAVTIGVQGGSDGFVGGGH
ncbi:uncharacterized protein LTR77_004689 [Saxophila tyrrhenica]|uniref:Uncharacterized protein n=1 Tax=Saxophila tyrrhenica TaxID=1690608 RepID=A0AAV9PD04_9PEZI|nr:hypothetical protein LTR77_004689 [Saxophila tyrrhenica]